MKSLVCKFTLPLALLVAGVLPHGQARAQGNAKIKPAVVVSLAPTDEQFADAEFFLRAAGLSPFLLFLPVGKAEASVIDATKPIGGYLTVSAEGEPKFCGFLTVTDFDMAMEKVEQFVSEKSDAGDDVTQLSMKNGNDVFIKKSGDWTFVSDAKANLAVLPENPVALLGGLEKKYNVAVQVNANNIPEDLKQLAVSFMQSAFDDATSQINDQGTDVKQLTDGKYGQMAMKQMKALVEETEQVTVGWALDGEDKSTYIDFTMTVVEGSDLAKQFELNEGAKSEYAGFLMPDSAAKLNFISKMSKTDAEITVEAMDGYRKVVVAQLEKDENLSEKELDVTREMIEAFFKAVDDTIRTGTMDGGATLLLQDDDVTFVAGGHVANAKSLEAPLRKLIDVAKNEPGFPDVEFDVAKHGDVSFHRATIPIPANDVQGRQIFGESLEVILGIGEKSVYFALGNNCVPTIRKVMDASGGPVDENAPQAQLTLSLAPIMNFAANVSGDEKAAAIAKQFRDGAMNDKIRITSRTIERGSTSRIKMDAGVFPVIGELIKSQTPGLGGGAR